MIFKNLFRRKGRTILTLVGIAIGVAAIVALGAVAKGLKAGFSAMTQGSQADLVLSQAEAMSALISSLDEAVADGVRALPGVADVDGMLYTSLAVPSASSASTRRGAGSKTARRSSRFERLRRWPCSRTGSRCCTLS